MPGAFLMFFDSFQIYQVNHELVCKEKAFKIEISDNFPACCDEIPEGKCEWFSLLESDYPRMQRISEQCYCTLL